MPNPDRSKSIGGSEVAAVLDLHPYLSLYELWQLKTGFYTQKDLRENKSVMTGTYFEDGVALLAKDKFGFETINKGTFVDGGDGKSGSIDRYITWNKKCWIGEVKIMGVEYYETWKGKGDAPLHQWMQLNWYQGLCSVPNGVLLIYVYEAKELLKFEYDFDAEAFSACEEGVEKFWTSIRENKPPKMKRPDDYSVFLQTRKDMSEKPIILDGNNYLANLLANDIAAKNDEKRITKIREGNRFLIAQYLAENKIEAKEILVDGYKLTFQYVKEGDRPASHKNATTKMIIAERRN